MPKISVIMPAYNAEKYIGEAIESILNQTFTDFEFIIIDDGSTDGAGAICDNYSKKDNRIVGIHVTNGGVSVARNKGLDVCTGDYITFVDSDDVVYPQFLEFLLRNIEEYESDFSYCGIRYTANPEQFKTIEYKEQRKDIFNDPINHYFDGWLCPNVYNKLFRREVIGDVRFKEFKRAEDLLFTISVLKNCRIVSGIKECVLYDYRQHPNSCMGDYDLRTLEDLDARLEAFDYIDGKYEVTRRKFSWQTYYFYLDFVLQGQHCKDIAISKKLHELGNQLVRKMWRYFDIPKWECWAICLSPKFWIFIKLVQHKLFRSPLYIQ